jgi:hypothetical protein
MEVGEVVVYIRSSVKHSPSIGTTFWVMSVSQKKIAHVTEALFGPRLYKLVSPVKPVKTEKQKDCLVRAKGLLASSVYSPKNVHTKTFLTTTRVPRRPKELTFSTLA